MSDDNNPNNQGVPTSGSAADQPTVQPQPNSPLDITQNPPTPPLTQPAATPTQTDSVLNPPEMQTKAQNADGDNTTQPTQGPVITSPQVPKKYGGKKMIATIFGIVLLVASIATGVYLVGRQQLTSTRAWDCRNYTFDMSRDGTVTATNGSTRNEPPQDAKIYINGNLVATLSVPALAAGSSTTLGQVDVPSTAGFDWRVDGTLDCENSGTYPPEIPPLTWSMNQVCNGFEVRASGDHQGFTARAEFSPTGDAGSWQNTQSWPVTAGGTETHSFVFDPTPNQNWWIKMSVLYQNQQVAVSEEQVLDCTEPTESPTATPTETPVISAQCLDIKIYDTSWNLLSASDLEALTSADTIRLTVGGTATVGTIDMARFIVNGTTLAETTDRKPGSDLFYSEYTLPADTASFSVNAQLHHTTLGWF